MGKCLVVVVVLVAVVVVVVSSCESWFAMQAKISWGFSLSLRKEWYLNLERDSKLHPAM